MNNLELASALRDLRDFLIIAGYEESHATRYTQIARHIARIPEDCNDLIAVGRLREIPGVGALIEKYIRELLLTGTTSKYDEWLPFAPITVLEMVRVPGLGAKTARRLWHEMQIGSLADLKSAEAAGKLDAVSGIGPKLKEAIRNYNL